MPLIVPLFTPNPALSAASFNHLCRGVAVGGAARGRRQAPAVRYQDIARAWWCRKNGRWIAIVSIPLKTRPAPIQLATSDGRTLRLHGRRQHTAREQHIQVEKIRARSNRWRKTWRASTASWPEQTKGPTRPSALLTQQPDVRQAGQRPSSPVRPAPLLHQRGNPTPGLDSFAVGAGTSGAGGGQGDPHRQLLLQRQYGVRRSRPGLHQHVLPYVAIDVQLGQSRPGRRHRRAGPVRPVAPLGPYYAPERQPE